MRQKSMVWLVGLLVQVFPRGAWGVAPGLEVSDNHRFIVRTDGAPFFWLGDTGWDIFRELSFDVSPPGASDNEVLYYLKTRKAQGFTVIHTFLLLKNNRADRHGHPPV